MEKFNTYETPEIVILELDVTDVIATSLPGSGPVGDDW